jgi:DNA processing protein
LKTDEKTYQEIIFSHEEMSYLSALNASDSFKRNFKVLYDRFKSFRRIYEAKEDDLKGIPELRIKSSDSITSIRSKFKPGLGFDRLQGKDVRLVTYWDADYPESLRNVRNAPPLLYVAGNPKYDFALSISIVGTRRAGQYGRKQAFRFSKELSELGFTIISGGASGIDSEAHRGCLEANGRTFAIFGSGIDVVFPAENRKLFKSIASTGALVSEFPPGTPPEPFRFPVRNRIIAGMSRGVLVVEASQKSGALITSEFAIEMCRDVMAIPGQIDNPNSAGVNQLIRDGAFMILSTEDILSVFNLALQKRIKTENLPPLSELQRKVVNAVGYEPKHVDDIAIEMKIPVSDLSGLLLSLQIDGHVKELAGKRYVRITS